MTDRPANPFAVSPDGVATEIREILSREDFPSDDALRAAVRRAVHRAAVGLDEAALSKLLDSLRSRFPDRNFETRTRVAQLEQSERTLQREVAELREGRNRLAGRQQAQAAVLHDLVRTAVADGRGVADIAGQPERLGPLVGVFARLLAFAAEQEVVLSQIEASFAGAKGGEGEHELAELVDRVARGDDDGTASAELERRLGRLGRLPKALLVGMQQSWTSGTLALLRQLSPDDIDVGGVGPLKASKTLAEVERRFSAVRRDIEKNVSHYYRGSFEQIYTKKMEEAP